MHRSLVVIVGVLVSACSATSGGGGGGASYVVGATCAAALVTDQCGAAVGHNAVVHCTSGVWKAVKDCNVGDTCAVKGGVATCIAGLAGTDASSGDDTGFVFDAITQPTDIQNGKDSATPDDVPVVEDTFQQQDVPVKDTGKDAGKDIKPDTGPAAATWGSCALNDTACLQSCVQSSCAAPGQACQNDPNCNTLQGCMSDCGKSPIVMPSQSGTPIPQNSGETQQNYCYRVCQAQAGASGVALDEAYIECVIGLCVDCATSANQNISQAQCQSSCGLENYCATPYNSCLQDSDCVSLYGCILTAADATAQNDCINASSTNAQSLFSALNTCLTDNKTSCVSP